MPEQKNNKAWSEKYKSKLQQAKEEVVRYQEIKTGLLKQLNWHGKTNFL
ncbi:MAG: hypothetical protein WKF59_26520 [Chitinophagaceae bacterium]